MIIILSPSKSQDATQVVRAHLEYTLPVCLTDSLLLLQYLRELSALDLMQLMKVSPAIAQLNYLRFAQMTTPFNLENSKGAIFTFKGDVYQNIAVDSYTKSDLDFAQQHLRILSGFYGYLRPLDLIQPYRLEMKTKLVNSRGGDLYRFWGQSLQQLVMKEQGPVINLASVEYSKVLHDCPVITPVFKDYSNGRYQVIAIHAKRARGMMANFIIENKITTPEKLKDFNQAGYSFAREQGAENELVFLR